MFHDLLVLPGVLGPDDGGLVQGFLLYLLEVRGDDGLRLGGWVWYLGRCACEAEIILARGYICAGGWAHLSGVTQPSGYMQLFM